MATLYLIEQNTVLRKSGQRLLFCRKPKFGRKSPGVREEDIIVEWPCKDVGHVMIFGNVQITTQALYQLLNNGIELALFTLHGKLLGQLTPPGGKNIILRMRQYEKQNDAEFVLNFSKEIVREKAESALEIVKDFRRNHSTIISSAECDELASMKKNIETAANIDRLRGIEGAMSARYFSLLGRMLKTPWQFKGRSRRPPRDEANAVLSFGYTIIASEIQSLLDGVGFDTYLGYYHQVHYGRPSLALDLMEAFRHTFIDRLMLRLFNLSILSCDDFIEVGKGGIYLSKNGKCQFFKEYEKMTGPYEDDLLLTGPKKGFRKEFQTSVNQLMKKVLGET